VPWFRMDLSRWRLRAGRSVDGIRPSIPEDWSLGSPIPRSTRPATPAKRSPRRPTRARFWPPRTQTYSAVSGPIRVVDAPPTWSSTFYFATAVHTRATTLARHRIVNDAHFIPLLGHRQLGTVTPIRGRGPSACSGGDFPGSRRFVEYSCERPAVDSLTRAMSAPSLHVRASWVVALMTSDG
jgi:hypothetical protein